MRENLIAVAILAVFAGMWVWVSTADADPLTAKQNNTVLKACLEQHGYTPEKFDTFDFNKSSACYHDWKAAETQKDYAKMRAFLKENPWFKGKNWKWEETAEYSCEKIYSTALLANITVCSKPYYIN
jgi:Zn-dependent M32 family carboxypeptidase